MLITHGPLQVRPWSGLFLDVEDLLLYLEITPACIPFFFCFQLLLYSPHPRSVSHLHWASRSTFGKCSLLFLSLCLSLSSLCSLLLAGSAFVFPFSPFPSFSWFCPNNKYLLPLHSYEYKRPLSGPGKARQSKAQFLFFFAFLCPFSLFSLAGPLNILVRVRDQSTGQMAK